VTRDNVRGSVVSDRELQQRSWPYVLLQQPAISGHNS